MQKNVLGQGRVLKAWSTQTLIFQSYCKWLTKQHHFLIYTNATKAFNGSNRPMQIPVVPPMNYDVVCKVQNLLFKF